MKRLFGVLGLGLALAVGQAWAAGEAASAPAKGKSAQQEKMAACNKDATGKKGDERKAFMKECLGAKPAAQAPAAAAPAASAPATGKAAQQEKMKTCNKDAAGKKGDERKAFMKACLSNKG